MLQATVRSKFLCPSSVDGPFISRRVLYTQAHYDLRQVVGSREAALETLKVLRQVVSRARFANLDQLIGLIRCVGRRLVEAQPKGHLEVGICIIYSLTVLQNIRLETPYGNYSTISEKSTTIPPPVPLRLQNLATQ